MVAPLASARTAEDAAQSWPDRYEVVPGLAESTSSIRADAIVPLRLPAADRSRVSAYRGEESLVLEARQRRVERSPRGAISSASLDLVSDPNGVGVVVDVEDGEQHEMFEAADNGCGWTAHGLIMPTMWSLGKDY